MLKNGPGPCGNKKGVRSDMGLLKKLFGTSSQRELKSIYPIVDKVEALEQEYAALTDAQLQAKTAEFKARYAGGETLDDLLPEAFATCREAAWRVLGMKPYRVQLVGGVVLHQGRIAEMKTGEGKTLVATLPAYLNALTGQGDPGESRFFLSLEDDIMRLFGSERVMGMMEKLGVDEDTPIDAKILSNAIENAQKQVESRNFQTRKTVLEYDDVMNTQRKVIYEQRRKVLDGENLKESVQTMLSTVISTEVQAHMGELKHMDAENWWEVCAQFRGLFLRPDEFKFTDEELQQYDAQALTDLLQERASDIYARKEAELGEPLMRELERVMMLRVVDEYWMDNIDAMQELRQGIGLRAYGQNDPVVAYKKEGYEMFESMIAAIQAETIRRIFLARVQVGATTVKRERVAKVTGESAGSDGTVKKQPVKKGQKVGRNDPCPCGSGKKYKKCCGMHEDE